MRVPLLVGWTEKIERTGESFDAECPECRGPQRFYAAKKRFNVSAFVAVSLWDSDEPVAQCSACLKTFTPESITRIAPATPAPTSLRARIARTLKPSKTAPARSEDDEIDDALAQMKKRLKR